MATIRDKMGHCLHGSFTSSVDGGFAFYVETRPQRLTQRRATDPLIRSRGRFFQRFLRCSGLWPGLGEGEPRSGLPPDCEPHSRPQPGRRDAYRLRLGPSPRAESVSHKAMSSHMFGNEWPILSRIVAIPPSRQRQAAARPGDDGPARRLEGRLDRRRRGADPPGPGARGRLRRLRVPRGPDGSQPGLPEHQGLRPLAPAGELPRVPPPALRRLAAGPHPPRGRPGLARGEQLAAPGPAAPQRPPQGLPGGRGGLSTGGSRRTRGPRGRAHRRARSPRRRGPWEIRGAAASSSSRSGTCGCRRTSSSATTRPKSTSATSAGT